MHISETKSPNITKFSVHVAYSGHGSVLSLHCPLPRFIRSFLTCPPCAFPREDPHKNVRQVCARVSYTCKRVLYTISYVYTFTKLHNRRIPNVGVGVRVGVGPVEFHTGASPTSDKVKHASHFTQLSDDPREKKINLANRLTPTLKKMWEFAFPNPP